MIDRRSFVKNATALAGLTSLAQLGCARPSQSPLALSPGIDAPATPPVGANALSHAGLATSLPEEHDYEAEIEGTLPRGLRGSLFRNGPGLFDRGGLRKRSVLDGDGMLQCFDFHARGVRFRNRFTRTEKYLRESKAGAFEDATWTTQAPGGRLSNLFALNMGNQAGVSVHHRGGRLYAFDESNLPYLVDPVTLETHGASRLGVPEDTTAVFSAHPKTDAATGEWIHFGLAYGRNMTAHLTTFDRHGNFARHREIVLPRYVYLHDYFVTARYAVFNLHPAYVQVFDFLLGRKSLAGSFEWRGEEGNLVMILPRDGGGEPVFLEAPAHWMWHALNAYERGDEIVAEFVGHDDPRAFIGENPDLFAVMEGRRGEAAEGHLRRYVIDVPRKRLRLETLSREDHEFPIVNPARSALPHRHGYFARSRDGESWWTQIARVDTETGLEQVADLGAHQYCAEPIFAPDPDLPRDEGDAGWLLSEVYDGTRGRSYLAILRAERVADGPIAKVHLRHHVPLSFHGSWVAS